MLIRVGENFADVSEKLLPWLDKKKPESVLLLYKIYKSLIKKMFLSCVFVRRDKRK